MPAKSRKHWYRIHIRECLVCGGDGSYRERVYGKRPKRLELVYLQEPYYDQCLEREALR